MKIVFVSPRIERERFTGGTYCVLRHANELVKRGHDVSIVAYPKSVQPSWLDLKAELIVPGPIKWRRHLTHGKAFLATSGYLLDYISHSYKGDYYTRATATAFLSDILPEADVTIATTWHTASIVAKYGKGKKAYFCQHYEPLFFDNTVDSSDAEATYSYGLNLIANSSWLKSKLEGSLRTDSRESNIYLALNAIDSNTFSSKHSQLPRDMKRLRIISYGGRDARWKGFFEMAMAVRAARSALPNIVVEWNVYGSSLLPPNNDIAPYRGLGFLNQSQLADAYQQHDVLLSASWYESYPLFPIEAMASGLGVITTAYGTEDYAINEKNCLVVEPRNVESITNAIIRLANDNNLLATLSSNASTICLTQNWETASSKMEEVLRRIAFSHEIN